MFSRHSLLIIAFFLGYALVLFNLYSLQVMNGEEYLARAHSQYAASDALLADRGAIYFTDKQGNRLPAVMNKVFPQIYAVPKDIADPQEAAHALAELVGKPAETLIKQFSKPNDAYELLAKKSTPASARTIQELGLEGIYMESVPQRFYPFATLAAHVLGFVAPNATEPGTHGRYGLEEYYDDLLGGEDGTLKNEKMIRPEHGQDLVLTIDPNIQIEAERVLDNVLKKFGAQNGLFLVLEPKTGKVLAMGANPGFDPNRYAEYDLAAFRNPLVQEIYEPGSVFKVITMAAGIDSGALTPETRFYDTGELKVSGRTIKNWDLKAHGWVTMTNVIEKSLNTGSAFAQRETGNDVFREYLQKFGFGEKTGVDLPGELKGNLSGVAPKSPPVAFATASFGQGVATTPLEMLNAIAAIANGGVLMRPYLNAELGPKEIRRVISPTTARQVGEMMVSAVDKAGVASIKGYRLAGKTGTAQAPDLIHGGYTDHVIDTYIGFGPATNPRFVVMIRIDEPPGAPHAAETVVPAFRDLAQFILNYYNIAPDRL